MGQALSTSSVNNRILALTLVSLQQSILPEKGDSIFATLCLNEVSKI